MCLIKCIRKIPNPSLRSRTLEPQSSYVTFWKITYEKPKPAAYQQRRQKEGRVKNPSQASSSSLPLLFISLCSCINDPVLDTPTPFHKHAYSGLPIKGATLSHKIHLHYFSENRRHAVNNLCHVDYQPYFSGNSKQTPLYYFNVFYCKIAFMKLTCIYLLRCICKCNSNTNLI